jgi:hypothetical protein
VTYIHQRYIPQLLSWLTAECNLYSSVIELRSSVTTEECILVSCSVFKSEIHHLRFAPAATT